MVQRVFFVTQDSLYVWLFGAPAGRRSVEFADGESGLREFDRFLAADPDKSSAMLIDVIEEEFSLDTIPKLGMRDRAALIERRRQGKFRRSPYRTSIFQGWSLRRDDQYSVVHSAISNHELVDPWMQVILSHKTPLCGVYSVPLMAPPVVRKLFVDSGAVMFVAPHQGNKLRQVFLQDGELRSARLSQGPGIGDDAYAQFVITETTRSRRYLERTRLLAGMETLQVCVVASDETAAKVLSSVDVDSPTQFQFISPAHAARRLGEAALAADDHFEEVFLSALAKRRPRHSYASSGENRYWNMKRMRYAIIATATATAAACSIAAAIFLSDVWLLSSRISDIQSRVDFLAETLRRENESFDPVKADSHEMQLAVDTGDYLLANRVPVPWIMNQLGAVLGDYPDIEVQELRWLTESQQTQNTERRRPGDPPALVVVAATDAVSAVLTADIVPFDGNLRQAFARIDQLAADLEARTNFQRAVALEYPFDASTNAAVSGEIVSRKTSHTARFRLRVYYELPHADSQAGGVDEST